jgi:hypothetical protein
MRKRFRWRNDTTESVDWEAFSCGFCSRYRYRTFQVKLSFKLLPSGKHLHKRSPSYDPRCPACKDAIESNDHMFQCQAVSRRRWQSSFITTIRKQAESSKTDPKLTHIMLAGMRSFFSDTDFPTAEVIHFPPQYHQLIASQEAIGWDHFVRGRISTLWAETQQDYMYRAHRSTKFDAAKWHRNIVNPMFVDCHNLWTLRNEERHGTRNKATNELNASNNWNGTFCNCSNLSPKY